MDRAGFEAISTGGGFWAWYRKESDETHTLITWSDDIELGAWKNRDRRDWQVGRYRDEATCDFLCVEERVTLSRAIELAGLIPAPKEGEQQYPHDGDLQSYWLREFGEQYRPHQIILDLLMIKGVKDESWHNDVAPHFEADAGDGQKVELWFYRADPNDRADEGDSIPADQTQYALFLVDYENNGARRVAPEDLNTNDPELAVQTFKGLLEKSPPRS